MARQLYRRFRAAHSRPHVRPGTPAPARPAPCDPLDHRALTVQNRMPDTSRVGYLPRRAGAQAADTSPSKRVTRVRIPPSAPAGVVQRPRTPYVSAADPDLCTPDTRRPPRVGGPGESSGGVLAA